MDSKTLISIIVPCRNEAGFIDDFIASAINQSLKPDFELELLIADGMSDDGTREVIEQRSRDDARVRLINNERKIVPTGLNAAIELSRGDIIVRMDVHTEYAADYVQTCVDTLLQTGADNVGGAWRAKGKTYLQSAIAAAFQSPFSSGGAGSHRLNFDGEVDSVYLGCWKKQALLEVGCFDEELVRNQDDELNYRLIKAGKKLWQSSSIKSYYYPRNSIKALYKQYSQYGYWKVRVMQKHKMPASIRHLIPGLFLLGISSLTLLSIVSQTVFYILMTMLALYSMLAVIFSIQAVGDKGMKYFPVMPVLFGAFHFGYGYGFLHGILDFYLLRRGGAQRFSRLTRG